jgi:hypothetical protein
MEKVEVEIKVYDNYIEITPVSGVLDNSTYEVKLKGLKELNGRRELDSQVIKLTTALTPAYTTIQAVQSLVENANIPEDIVLYHIREASKFVDYIASASATNVNATNPAFEVTQLVKYKAAYECLLRFYVEKAAGGGVKGQLGDVLFQEDAKMPDISMLLKSFKVQIQEWQDAIKGYKLEGRAKPLSGLRGSKAVVPGIMTDLTLDYNRGIK